MSRIRYFGQRVGGVFSHPLSVANPQNLPLLYSDGATSCVICFACGVRNDEWTICFGHLDQVSIVDSYFKRVASTFENCTSQRVQLYAIGAVDYEEKNGANCGNELKEELCKQLEQFNVTNNPVEDKIWLEFADQSRLFNKHPENLTVLGYDVASKQLVFDTLDLKKPQDLPYYGPHCAACGLYPGRDLLWMNESAQISNTDIEMMESQAQNLAYLAYCSTEEKDLRMRSTTPAIEPPEFFTNMRTAILWAREVLSEKYELIRE